MLRPAIALSLLIAGMPCAANAFTAYVSNEKSNTISVVDLDLTKAPLRVAVAPADAAYVFNSAGQTIDVGGLLCLLDAEGPCANAVKDSQRTKTHDGTRRTLSLVWGAKALGDRTARAAASL